MMIISVDMNVGVAFGGLIKAFTLGRHKRYGYGRIAVCGNRIPT